MTFRATKQRVLNRGVAPDSFLEELVTWGRAAPDELFAPNDRVDIYTVIKPRLASQHPITGDYCWEGLLHRRAAGLETMRVHAGYESSWNFNEGVDRANKTSLSHITGEETGVFQVSFDSERLEHEAMKPFAAAHDILTPEKFIFAMKADHALAFEYYMRLVRIDISWAGPLVHRLINPWLRIDSMLEFERLQK